MKRKSGYSDIWNIDLSESIKEYEFSKEAIRKIDYFINVEDFHEKESGEILYYLLKELRVISFGDYLKRYLYLQLQPDMAYEEVSDDFYIDVLLDGFRENHVPFHFADSTTMPRRSVNRWLSQHTVSRSVIFLLGFGLRMKTETVSEFLQKVLLEEDFNFEDPQEVVFWFCYEHQKPYAYAMQLLEESGKVSDMKTDAGKTQQNIPAFAAWKTITETLEYRLDPQKCLRRYLLSIMQREAQQPFKETYEAAVELYNRVRERIAIIRMQDSRSQHFYTPDMIKPIDVEKELYAGIPRGVNGNMRKAALSVLSAYMNNHYLSRQRIEKILSGKYPVRRFDILNMCFYLHGSDVGNGKQAKERFLGFVRDANYWLGRCHMYQLHPSNPSEAFMMICLFTELPLVTYSDVLELSFDHKTEK